MTSAPLNDTCTGAAEHIHGWLFGWIECRNCEFRHMAVLPACAVDDYDGDLECARCRQSRGLYLGIFGDAAVNTSPWFPA